MNWYVQGLNLSAKGQHARAIEAFERALAAEPNDTRVLFALGNTARILGMLAPAEAFYRRVLELEPGRVEAIVNLANLLRSQGLFSQAESLLRPALAQHPDSPELWVTLGSTLREGGDGTGAAEHYRKALALRPGYATAMVNLADIVTDDGAYDDALALYDRAIKIEPDCAQARLNRSILHLLRGDLKNGWRDYASRLKVAGKVPVPDHGLARWNGDTLRRTRLLVTAEQGVGDHLMFASLLPELAARAAQDGGRIILECEPRLRTLFARSFANVTPHDWQIDNREGVVRSHYGWLKSLGGASAAIEMGSLARLMRKTSDAFPVPHVYLVPDSDERARWQAAFSSRPRPLIGVCWRSGSVGGSRALQYAPLEAWGTFLRALPGTPICVQYDARPQEIEQLSAMAERPLVVPPNIDQKVELDRTAAMLSTLDGVVTAPTAVAWLAAGLGVPTFKALYDTAWTSFGKDYEPFAPSAKCLMPKTRGDWSDVFGQALKRLSQPHV